MIREVSSIEVDEDLMDLGPEFFVPYFLPIVLSSHRQIKRNNNHDFGLNVSVGYNPIGKNLEDYKLNYWLFPDQPRQDLEETAETTGLPVFNAELSPGRDFDIAYMAIYRSALHHLGLTNDQRSRISLNTLRSMGWTIFTIEEFQKQLMVTKL
jgi:hypothetical protein